MPRCESQRTGSYQWVVLAVAVTALTTGGVVYLGVSVLIPFWKSEYDLTPATAALGATAIQAGPILSMLFLGRAIDRYGERRVVALSMVAMGLTSFLAATIASNFPVLLVFITVMGAFYGAILPGGQRAIIRWFPPSLRGMATGVRQSGLPLGGSIAALILPLLALRGGWPAAMYVQGGVAILGGLIFGGIYREGLHGQPAVSQGHAPIRLGQLVLGLVRDRTVRALLIAGLALASLQYTFSAQILIFLHDQLHVQLITAGFILAVAQGAGILGRVGIAWVSDRLWPGRRMRSLQGILLISAIPLACLVFVSADTPLWTLLTLSALLGMLSVGWYPLYLVQIAEAAPQNAVASTISFAITLNQVVAAAMPPVFGLIIGWFNYPVGWLLLAGVLVLAAAQIRRSGTAAPTPTQTHAIPDPAPSGGQQP